MSIIMLIKKFLIIIFSVIFSTYNINFADEINAKDKYKVKIAFPNGNNIPKLFSFNNKEILIGKLSSAQFTLKLLQQQKNYFHDHSLKFGGYLKINPQIWNGSSITTNKSKNSITSFYKSGQGFYVTTATFYTSANIGNNIITHLSFSGNENKNLKVDDAFVIFGNLDQFPWYASIGKTRVPFGFFAGGGPWTSSLVKMLFRSSRITNASFSYYKDNYNMNISIFQNNNSEKTSSGACSTTYSGKIYKFNYMINAGYVYNLHATGNPSFNSITKNDADNTLKRVGAINLDLKLNHNIFITNFGWAQTINKSNKTNDNYAGAWYIQGGISLNINKRLTKFNLAYNSAYNTASIPITLSGSAINKHLTDSRRLSLTDSTDSTDSTDFGVNKMIIASVQRSIFTENILFGLEYNYMHMYNRQHTNSYTADISVYF